MWPLCADDPAHHAGGAGGLPGGLPRLHWKRLALIQRQKFLFRPDRTCRLNPGPAPAGAQQPVTTRLHQALPRAV